MASPFVAEIRIFGCNFAPTGWAQCNGQLLPISQNTALFSLLGTYYGGDGKSTFALPNLQGSAPIHVGGDQPGKGLSDYFLGQVGGAEFITVLQTEMAAHSHALQGDEDDAAFKTPQNMFLAAGNQMYLTPPVVNVNLAPQAIGLNGGSLPHNNMMPYLVLNFCIAMQGVFPPRS
jgi:microcystin-dependent protein